MFASHRKPSTTLSLLVVVLSFILVLASACSKADETGKGTQDQSKNSEQTKSAAKPVEIEFWYGLGGKLGDNMKSLIDKFNQSQNEVIVKPIVQGNYSETSQKLQAAIASKKVPAVALSFNPDWAKKGYYAQLDELLTGEPSIKPDDYVQAFWKSGQVDGKQYAIPMYGSTQVLYYRKDMLEKAGIKPEQLRTWEGLAEAAKQLTVREGDQVKVYGWEPMWGSGNMIDSTYSHGGKIISDDGKEVLIDSKVWVDTWESFRKWIHEDKIMRIHSGGQGWEYWYKTIDDVMQGRAAGYTGSSGDQGDLDFSKIAAYPQPAWEGFETKAAAGGSKAVIFADVPQEQQKAAMKWLAFFTSPENSASWSMNTGYIAVRNSSLEDPAFKAYSEKNPQSQVPLQQAMKSSVEFVDPTGGKIFDALNIAADKVQIENVPAAVALKEAKEKAQKALDQALGGK
ncbi:ABC transporter substrate-binding protein [Paenibacillus sp. MZ04-78.2]|uniref:ABC transporter substrate-binding protein n=1 Tax=Paenibacillus sp. MZ04-78.2 TaxID=2962034 RepID=UPI0020B854AA|nr:ABC transporter substrate-binding protein [Paenibacillus sp. MZ04-78.2]MCP3776594.1 ABC transporter substrate-binding protein [Paenibacillus sp. MZ04-78.2]